MSDAVDFLVIFDLDGTLNNTELYSVPANLTAMKEFGAPPEVQNRNFITSTFGMTSNEYVKEFMPNFSEDVRKAYLKRVSYLELEIIPKLAKPFKNIPELLISLKELNIKTAVCSNASIRYISAVLKAIGLFDKIDFIQPLVEGCTKKETLGLLLKSMSPKNAIMVGDRIFDIEAASHNNLKSIGCAYGYNPEETKLADYTVSDPEEILTIIKSYFNI